MTTTAARHRAPLSRRARLRSTWLPLARASAVPVGVLAGCTAVVARASAGPEVGLLGLGALVLPYSIATWWGRSRATGALGGRHAAGRPVPPGAPATTPATGTAVVAAPRLPLVLEARALAVLQAATGHPGAGRLPAGAAAEDTPSRLFTVSAGGHEVEVVLLTREEQAARDLRVLQALAALPAGGPEGAGHLRGAAAGGGAVRAGEPMLAA